MPKLNRAYDKRVRAKKSEDLMLGFEVNKGVTPRKGRKKK